MTPAQDTTEKLISQRDRHEAAWSIGYGAVPKLIQQHGLTRGVEVGVAFGGHSQAMLKACDRLQLTGVDPYRHDPGYDDPMNLPQPMFDRLHQMTLERLSGFGERYEMIREDSTTAGQRFRDDALDFVYLDADHSEMGVWQDLVTWAAKVREGGIIAGHDYGHTDFPGVKRAVDRFFSRFGWQVNQAGHGVWWVKRRPLPVTFFTPCYNCEAWVIETARSIIETNLKPGDEYILVNDGSTDQTADRLREIEAMHPAVRVVEHETNQGGSAARNTAIKHGQNPLLFCLDSDNILLPQSVEALRKHLFRAGVDAVGLQTLKYFSQVNGVKEFTRELVYEPVITDLQRYLSTTRVPGGSGNYLFTRDAWARAGGYPEGAGALDAWGFGLRKAATGSKTAVLPGTAYHHRYLHDSYWVRHENQGTINQSALNVLRPFFDQIDPRDVSYLESEAGQSRWFSDLNRRPLRVRNDDKSTGRILQAVIKPGLLKRLRKLVNRAA